MKPLIASVLAASVLLSGASASYAAPVSAQTLDSGVYNVLPDANYAHLTNIQIAEINAVLHSGGDHNDMVNGIRAALL
ncbi:hypothetical protein [Sagittula stellata]|uniref:Uncharacterized protein n=1 Tax=Sagittula stellata (strain ATCC 700073 / DSM 11524 / E-37) TaxID=388399 RepID=A3K960_SAGS3|nr:hypothetical protein [Sagittula stellata]EBA06232.1 hypothetical protein SSE37_15156 [Sagittula stellata E-37]